MKNILITGSTDGIGKETARRLAAADCRVWIHGRNDSRLQQTRKEITEETGNRQIETVRADFSSLKEVKRMSMELYQRMGQLDVLINNAGVMSGFRENTMDGYDRTFQVNYLSPFLLTNLLLPLMKESEQGRIIHVASMTHAKEIDFDNLAFSKQYTGSLAYSATKLYNILFSNKLARMLAGGKITSNSLHPGVINTKLLRQNFGNMGDPVGQGAETPVYLASAAEAAKYSGKYFSNSHLAKPAGLAGDKQVQDRLWNESLRMVSNYLSG